MPITIRSGASISLAMSITANTLSSASAAPFPLQPVLQSQWRSAGIGGTGCWWRMRNEARWRFAMSDDRAVAVIAGKVVKLTPSAGAKAWFPFTYDRWGGDAVSIAVRAAGVARQKGVERLERVVTLTITQPRAKQALVGTMVCGS